MRACSCVFLPSLIIRVGASFCNGKLHPSPWILHQRHDVFSQTDFCHRPRSARPCDQTCKDCGVLVQLSQVSQERAELEVAGQDMRVRLRALEEKVPPPPHGP